MVIGVARVKVRLPENHSLKGKRKVIKSMTAQVGNRFNVAVAEVAGNDLWQWAEIGVAAVGNSQPFINRVLDKVLDFIESSCPVELVDAEIELIHMGGSR